MRSRDALTIILIRLTMLVMPKLRNKQSFSANKFGFTLIELLIAISIIVILIGFSTVAFEDARKKGRDSKRKQDLATIKSALSLYFQDNGVYPSSITHGDIYYSNETQPWFPGLVPTYITILPIDIRQESAATTYTYRYGVTTDRNSFTLWANLENENDKERITVSGAACTDGKPLGTEFDFCVKPTF